MAREGATKANVPPWRMGSLDPQEDAEIPWRDIQDAISQVAAAGTPGLVILLLVLAAFLGAEYTVTPPRGVWVLRAGDGRVHGRLRSLPFGFLSGKKRSEAAPVEED